MPRDITTNHPGYVNPKDFLEINPFKEKKKKEKKKRKKGEVERGPENKLLKPNEQANFKISEMGNYPLVNKVGEETELRPKNYYWRLKLAADADWQP